MPWGVLAGENDERQRFPSFSAVATSVEAGAVCSGVDGVRIGRTDRQGSNVQAPEAVIVSVPGGAVIGTLIDSLAAGRIEHAAGSTANAMII